MSAKDINAKQDKRKLLQQFLRPGFTIDQLE